MRLGRNEAELPLKMSKHDCATARAKLPPVEPWLSVAHSLMAGRLNPFCRTELKKQVFPLNAMVTILFCDLLTSETTR